MSSIETAVIDDLIKECHRIIKKNTVQSPRRCNGLLRQDNPQS